MGRFCILLLLFCSAQLCGQQTGNIVGSVLDSASGEPVPFCTVIITGTAVAVQADIYGMFMFRNVAADTYDICVHQPGYKSDTLRQIIVPGNNQSVRVKFLISPSGNNYDWGRITVQDTIPIVRVPVIDHSMQRKRMILVGGTELGLATGSLIGLSQLWYKDYPHSSFHTFNDNREWLQMDKIGHMQTAYTTGSICTHLWYWTGMQPKRAIWIGGLSGFAYQAVIEVMDGYSVGWGFSTGDILANAMGSALFISQELCWGQQRIQPKFGFRQSGYADYRPSLLGNSYIEQLLKDYNGQTYWLSVNPSSFCKHETKFPSWLNIALGYGANGMTGGNENPVMYNAQGNEITLDRYRQYYLSLDVDLTRIPVKSKFLRGLFRLFSFVKIPAPGIEFSKHGIRPVAFAF